MKDSSETDSDEGPLRKHRRLTVDHWAAVSATMDRLKKEHSNRTGDILSGGQRTRDVGVLCSERVPVNDKCIMVGTTGIAALKAEYGDDFTNFEIIQDVGYSSESSTHLSGDDAGLDGHFDVRIYKYTKDNQPTPLSLREDLESVPCLRNFHCLGSSLESSSSAAASLDDSGLGTGEALTTGDSGDVLGQFRVDDDYDQEELDYLETVLDECVDFGASAASDPEELHFNLSGLDSDDPSDNFHTRSSFTTSAQVFYKMISVDSDNGDGENPNDNNNNLSTLKSTENNQIEPSSDSCTAVNASNQSTPSTKSEDHLIKNSKCVSSDSDPETYNTVQAADCSVEKTEGPATSHRVFCSTPVRSSDKLSHKHQGLKRKRGCESIDGARMTNRVRSWLNRCTDFSTSLQSRKPASRNSPDLAQTLVAEDVSSCDASCECTSSSSDEGNVYSSMSSSFCEDDVFRLKPRTDGSVETVVHALLDAEFPFLLPPPPSSTESLGSTSRICCRVKRRGQQTKAFSDGDIEKRRSLKAISNLSIHHAQNRHQSKRATNSGRRQYFSLPTSLRPTSESSTDDNYVSSTVPSHSDTKTIGYNNHSSSSEISKRKRRRSRKKSSSSNRSSTSVLLSSGDHSRHRSRTITSSTNRCRSRRRHLSQRSDFYCPDMQSSDEGKSLLKVEIPPVEENGGFDEHRRASSALLSPVESDIVLTHLEEQSTVSDQVWDGYQEMPYLSEGYSEATVDEDAVRKLTEFGDDYGSVIGLPLRLLEPPDDNNNKEECVKSPKKSSKSIPVNQRVSSISQDSDSDSEDLHYVIEEAGKALHFARAILKRRETGVHLTSAGYADLLATCGTHLRCLETIRKHIDGKEHNFSASDLTELHYLIDEWQELKRNTEMFEKSEDPARQKYIKAQENIDALFNKMSQLSSFSDIDISRMASWEDVEKNMSMLQMVLSSLQEAKEQLLSVNLQVHRFTTEYGDDENFKDCSLKEDITELYRQWEDAYEQNGTKLTELETLKTDWEVYNEKIRSLKLRIIAEEFQDDCDNSRLISTETGSDSFQKDLEELEESSGLLESRLKGGDAWTNIEQELRDLRRRIHRKDIPQRTASPSVNRRSPSSRVEEDADDHFEDAIQQLCEDRDHSRSSTPKKKDAATSISPKRNRSRFWRIVKVAVPVQVALVLLYCLACYLEPSCCNTLNNFNFSLTPQLRYFGGRPPV